jgi:serine/threonine-protein kinase
MQSTALPVNVPRFRFADGERTGVRTDADLARLLQTRLRRTVSVVLGVFPLFLLLVGLRLTAATPGDSNFVALGQTLYVLLPFILVFAVAWWWLRERTPREIAALRRCELAVTVMISFISVSMLVIDFPSFLPFIDRIPLDTGMSQAVLMSMSVVSYGVLIPNTWQRCVRVIGLMLLLVVGADAWNFAHASVAPSVMATYLGAQWGVLLAFAAYAVFGAYRLDLAASAARDALQLGQYVLLDRLGSGGMGEVHRAEHQLLRRPCAVKLIRPEHAGNPDVLRRFEREVQATAKLTHPNTVAIYDYGIADDGTFYYVMEYLPGENLEQLVRREGPLSSARAAHVLRQVAGALAEAHAVGLTHRDIKPGNIMLGERGGMRDVAKLLDFGLVVTRENAATTAAASGVSHLTELGMVVGTPAYMSPEQCAGEERPGPASDVYSLGAVGYFLVTGQAPFDGRAPLQMMLAHMSEPPPSARAVRPDVSVSLDAILQQCMAKSPDDRIPSAKALAASLAEVADA